MEETSVQTHGDATTSSPEDVDATTQAALILWLLRLVRPMTTTIVEDKLAGLLAGMEADGRVAALLTPEILADLRDVVGHGLVLSAKATGLLHRLNRLHGAVEAAALRGRMEEAAAQRVVRDATVARAKAERATWDELAELRERLAEMETVVRGMHPLLEKARLRVAVAPEDAAPSTPGTAPTESPPEE